jgi:hypothetical protein
MVFLGSLLPDSSSTGAGQDSRDSFESANLVVISNVRIVPFTSPTNGREWQMVLCDITNNNTFPVECVAVTMKVQFQGVTKDYEEILYCAEDHEGQLIQPGQTYSQSGDEGEILADGPLYGLASNVTVSPLRAYQQGQWEQEHGQ